MLQDFEAGVCLLFGSLVQVGFQELPCVCLPQTSMFERVESLAEQFNHSLDAEISLFTSLTLKLLKDSLEQRLP